MSMGNETPKLGRPPLPEDERLEVLTVRAKVRQVKAWKAAATGKKSLGDWIREVLDRAAKRSKKG